MTLDHFSAQYIRQAEAVLKEVEPVKIELTGMLNVLENNNTTPIPLLANSWIMRRTFNTRQHC